MRYNKVRARSLTSRCWLMAILISTSPINPILLRLQFYNRLRIVLCVRINIIWCMWFLFYFFICTYVYIFLLLFLLISSTSSFVGVYLRYRYNAQYRIMWACDVCSTTCTCDDFNYLNLHFSPSCNKIFMYRRWASMLWKHAHLHCGLFFVVVAQNETVWFFRFHFTQ